MQKKHRLVIDQWCEIYTMLRDRADEVFWEFVSVDPVPGSVYVVGRQNLIDNRDKFRSMAESGQYVMVFCNTAEGSWTLEAQIQQLRIDDLAQQGRVLLVSGAEVDPRYACVTFEHFLSCILDYPENVAAQQHTQEIFATTVKPFKFLFLNGRARPHRKYLYERFRRSGLLDQALWTMLDSKPTIVRYFDLQEGDINVMATASELRMLPTHYEVPRYREPEFGPIVPGSTNLKQELFSREWGEIYLEPRAYMDTYFSLVTETVCAESTLSFRTEKIAKPLAMGHPFIVASTPGFYRDLHNLGFRTFRHLIDESFDLVDHAQTRMDRIVDVVTDLCAQDLTDFLAACGDICKYNQQHLLEITQRSRRDFPGKFFQFLDQHG